MLDILLYVLGILIILVGLAASIALHEIGHLLPAKLFGVRVTQYMVGFGRTLWSKKRGETEYGVKAIPLGGYVAMTGMYPPAADGSAPRASTTGFLNTVVQEGAPVKVAGASGAGADSSVAGSAAASDAGAERGIAGMVNDARLASAETIAAGEDHRTFYRLPAWKKIVVMLGGPLMNLVLAFIFFGIVISGFGMPASTTTLGTLSECLVPATSTATSCSSEDPVAPAAAAGLKPGDTIESVDGVEMRDWEQFRSVVSESPGETLTVTVSRPVAAGAGADGGAGSDGATEQVTVDLVPAENPRQVFDDAGNPVIGDDGQPVIETVGMVGVTPTSELQQRPLSEVPGFVGQQAASVVGVIVRLPERMVDVWNAAFGPDERDPNGPIGPVGVGRIAGEIVSMDEAPIAARAQSMFGLLGSLNLALFVFNLIPLMPLDGGHIAGAIYEWLKRGFARLRGKPDPGPIDTAKMVPVTFVVVIVLGAMSLLLAYADLVKPVSLFG